MRAAALPLLWLAVACAQAAAAAAPRGAAVPGPAPAAIEADMATLPGGACTVGNPNPYFGDADERPAHEVVLRAYRIARHAVTFAQYDAFARATHRALPRDEGWGRGQHPVIHVSWHDAVAYAEWASARTGHRYRLPTEDEWECAARGGPTGHYPWGEHYEDGHANAVGTSPGDAFVHTAPVGSFAPNALGLHDMVGNVEQWVADCYVEGYANASADGSAVQPAAGTAGVAGTACAQRVRRGGSWGLPGYFLRVDYRNSLPPAAHTDALGFRLAGDVDGR